MVDDYEDFQDFLVNDEKNSSVESSAEFLPPPTPRFYNNTNVEIQNSHSRITTNASNANGSLSIDSDADDELWEHEFEKSQRLFEDGQQSNESLDKKEKEPIDITLATFDKTSPTTTVTAVQHSLTNDRPETISSSSDKRKRSTSQSDSSRQIEQRVTTNDNPTNNSNIDTMIVIAPIPLVSTASLKTDRNTTLTNCFGDALTFFLLGPVPFHMEAEMTIVHRDQAKNRYYGLFRFEDYDNPKTGKFKNTLRRNVELKQLYDNIYMIELNKLAIRKQKNDTNETEQENGKKFYKLTNYLTGKQINVKKKGSTIFVRDYKLNNIQLAIRFFSNGVPLPITSNWDVKNETILLSNVIEAVHDFTRTTNAELGEVIITNITPGGQFISFDNNNQCTMELEIKLPNVFGDQPDCDGKWLEMSLFNEKLNSIYSINTNEGYKNSIRMKIESTYFIMQFPIVKKTLPELEQNPDVLQALHLLQQPLIDGATYISSYYNINSIIASIGLNKFHFRFRLLSSITTTDGEEIIDYPNAPIWHTDEFTEFIEDLNNVSVEQTQTTSGGIEQNNIESNADDDSYADLLEQLLKDHQEQSTIN